MKIISRFFIFIFTVLFLSLAYLSLVGIETSSFNNRIQKNLKNIDTNLDIKLNTVKLKLDPISFKLNLKTIGPTIFYRDKGIELENIKSDLLFSTLISRKFSSSNLSISSKSVDLKKFVSFVRGIENRPDLYLLENFIKSGFIIIDMNLFFDEKGKMFAFQGRAFGQETPKYITIILDSTKNKIYGLNRIKRDKPIYAVEGPIDSLFLDNCVAVAGAEFTSLSLDTTIIFDNDRSFKYL